MSQRQLANITYAPPDAVFELKAAFDRDDSPVKINLGPGAYLHDNGEPWILPSVACAERAMAANHPGHEYLPIMGLPEFRQTSARVIFGERSPLLSNPRLATLQTISGTGAVHVAAQFIKTFLDCNAKVYVSDPSWSNHRIMFEYSGFTVIDYPYYDNGTRAIRWNAFKDTLARADPGSVFVLHACAHNPTGCDLSQTQWEEVGRIMKDRQLVPILDSAYQGFATGDLDKDAWAVRYLTEQVGLPALVCQSFSKSMGLYGERVGALHIVLPENDDPQVIRNIESQLGWISRKEISTPGRYGATLAATVLGDAELYAQWEADLITMSTRISSMRVAVRDGLSQLDTPGNWDHVVSQIGMFSYTGLSKEQVAMLQVKHIYMLSNGRISVSGLNSRNVEYFCQSVSEVVRATS